MNQQPPDRLLRSFERYLRATNRSERTVGNYLENLHQVEAFLRPRGVRLRDATRADLEEFLADLLARRSAATAAPATRSCACCTAGRFARRHVDARQPREQACTDREGPNRCGVRWTGAAQSANNADLPLGL